MAAYCVMGTMIGLEHNISPYSSVVMGMLTASFGGILRDVLTGETSVLLRDEIYITATLLGSSSYIALISFGIAIPYAISIAALLAFLLRAALQLGWTMPRYKPRRGRKNK